MTRQAAIITRGRGGDIHQFSQAKAANPRIQTKLEQTLAAGFNETARTSTWSDPAYVIQFACVWQGVFGVLTRPHIKVKEDGSTVVCASFSDDMTSFYPIEMAIDEFFGYYTSLVRKEDAEKYSLDIHPIKPNTVPPPHNPPAANDPDASPSPQASLPRLNFHVAETVDTPTEANSPVVVILTKVLPLPPKCTFELNQPITDYKNFSDKWTMLHL